MTLGEILESVRVELDDLLKPYRYEDDELIRYVNEAENEACIRALLLPDDSTAQFTEVYCIEDTPNYLLDPLVIYATRADLEYNGSITNIPKITRDQLDDLNTHWKAFTPGLPYYFMSEMVREFKLVPPPGLQYNGCVIRLTVFRLPITSMVDRVDTPEIPAIYHRFLSYWVCHRCYSKKDSATYNQIEAERYSGMFEAIFGRRPTARELENRRGRPVERMRSRIYGT
jgi:hypothetical protein